MIRNNLPALLVVLPLLGAVVAPLLGRGRHRAWALATLVSWAVFAMSIALLAQVMDAGPISYALGNWAPPIGIEYRVDLLNAFVLLIVTGVAAAVTPFARLSVVQEIADDRVHFFYSAYLMCIAGLLGITITGDAFNLYVLLEISSLATYVLVAMGRGPRALRASFNYLILGTIGATFLLIGIGHLYMATGTLNMLDIAERIRGLEDSRTVRSAFAFIIVGASLKLALFPLHTWLPNAYTYAPSSVSALLAATATKVGAYVLLRFLFTIFGVEVSFTTFNADMALLGFAAAAILVGSIVAIRQHNVKRMLAYSSVAQIGYIALGIALMNVSGLTGAVVHLFNHALIKGTLFLALGCVAYRIGVTELKDMQGLGRRMPWTFAAFTLGGLSLIGVPLTAGFVSKWYLVQAAIERGWWPVAVLIVVGSLLAIAYVWRVVETVYLVAPQTPSKQHEAPLSLVIPTWALVIANFYFGVQTEVTVGSASAIALQLLHGVGASP